MLLTSRRGFRTDSLSQVWRSLEAPTTGHLTVISAALVSIPPAEVAVFDITLPALNSTVADVEESLTRHAEELLRMYGGGHAWTPKWVSRTFVGQDPPDNWIPSDDSSAQSLDRYGMHIRLSWGNNLIWGETDTTAPEWREVVRGLVDAQVLWTQLDDIVRNSGREIRRLTTGEGPTHTVSLQVVDDVERQLIAHELSFDEFETQVQGIRHEVARRQLQAWNVAKMRSRAQRRAQDLGVVARQEVARRSSRYQSKVEMILFILGLTALIQTALAVIQTAFSGGVATVPGGKGGFLEWVREVNLDLVLGVVTFTLVAILWTVLRMRRSALNDRS